MTILDPRLWLAVVAAMAIAYGAGRWQQHGVDQARYQARELAAVKAARTEEQRRTDEQARIAKNAKDEADQARADARAAGDVSERLRARIAELLAKRPAPAGGSAPAQDSIGMLADVLSRADERAQGLAEYADQARIAGAACEAAYDSLAR